MEVVQHVEVMEEAPPPDLLEAHKDKVVTIYGVTGTMRQLAKICPIDLNDPSVSVESKNEYVIKVENEAGIEIEPEYESYYERVLEKHGLDRKFSVKANPESSLENHNMVQPKLTEKIEKLNDAVNVKKDLYAVAPKVEINYQVMNRDMRQQQEFQQQVAINNAKVDSRLASEIETLNPVIDSEQDENEVQNSPVKEVHLKGVLTASTAPIAVDVLLPTIESSKSVNLEAKVSDSPDLPDVELDAIKDLEDTYKIVTYDNEPVYLDNFEPLFLDEEQLKLPIELYESEADSVVEFTPEREILLAVEDEEAIETFELALDQIIDLEPEIAEAAQELISQIVDKAQELQKLGIVSTESNNVAEEQMKELEQLLTELCEIVGIDCSEIQTKRLVQLLISGDIWRYQQNQALSQELLFSDEGTHEGLNQLVSWLKALKQLIPSIHELLGKYALQPTIRWQEELIAA